MEFTAEVTVRTDEAITEDDLFAVAEVGGVAVGRVGEHLLETTLTVKADNVREATILSIAIMVKRIAGDVVAVDVMTPEEADRRSARRARLVGVSEVASLLGVSRQRVSILRRRDDFPSPLVELSTGPVWREGDLSTFRQGWQRKAGRPRKVAAS